MDENINEELIDTTYLHSNFKSVLLDNNNHDEISTRSTELMEKKAEVPDIIPTSIKIIYSIPSFGKMSCLILLK
jgi:hypothetical protein